MIELLIGGALRLAPEVLNFFDRQNQRNHELAIADKGLEKSEVEAIADVSKTAAVAKDYIPTDYPWLNAVLATISMVSATVRPFLTYWHCVLIYTLYKIALYMSIMSNGGGFWQSVQEIYTPMDYSIMLSMISFWFVDRTLRKSRDK